MNCCICASLSARTDSESEVGMKNSHIVQPKTDYPRKAGSVRLVRSKENACGLTACSTFGFQPPEAAPSASQEEDRRDIEDTDHHGAPTLHRAIANWQRTSQAAHPARYRA